MRASLLLGSSVLLLAAAGCGSSSDSSSKSSSKASSSSSSASSKALTVESKEYAFTPGSLQAKSGKVTFTLDNQGKIEHELVVLKTDAAPGSLKVGSNGRVSEKDSVGEVSETGAGAKQSSPIHLDPGKYVFVCNIPGHYKDGMAGQLTVN